MPRRNWTAGYSGRDELTKNIELERVVKNLKSQNSLLKEENELLRVSTQENSNRETELCREVDRLQRMVEEESHMQKAKGIEDLHW